MSVLFSLPLQHDSEKACAIPAAANMTKIILYFINFNSAFQIVIEREKCQEKHSCWFTAPAQGNLVPHCCLVGCDLKKKQQTVGNAITSSASTVSTLVCKHTIPLTFFHIVNFQI